MKVINNIIKKYSKFVSLHPYLVLFLVIIVTVIGANYAKTIQTKNLDYKSVMPNDLEVIKAMDILDDKFGGSDSLMIEVELSDDGKIKDIRDPEVINYINILDQLVEKEEDVISVNSPATLLKQINNGYLPKDYDLIKKLTVNELFNQYISKDNKIALIKVRLTDDYDEMEIVRDFQKLISMSPKINGIEVNLAGETVTQPIVRGMLSGDMQKTSNFSMIGIIIILILIFRSIKYGLIPLTTIIFGIIWAMGFVGLKGMGMSSATSGVISMIMGIGIDFGIQTISRFREELLKGSKNRDPNKVLEERIIENSMIETMSNVVFPMFTTTLAALIGFKAMSMGQLTVMEEMGVMMSYGVTACFLAAITVVPSIIIILERISFKIKAFKLNKNNNI